MNKILPITLIILFIFIYLIGFLYIKAFIDKDFIIFLSAVFVIFGYFITHYLDVKRKLMERRYEIVLELARSLRFFIGELDVKKDQQKLSDFRDRFQDSYFQFSLIVTKGAYRRLMDVTEASYKFSIEPTEENKIQFQNVLGRFINHLRKEIFDESKIAFGTYDFRIGR